ncbi:hypothetical protein A2U01_0066931, partial [Trifolium medium]|nr:hypothetical protein [Trifolium medium]
MSSNTYSATRKAAGLEHVIAARLQHLGSAKEIINSICKNEDRDTAG